MLREISHARSYHFVIAMWRAKEGQNPATLKRYWEIIADNLSKAGWSWSCVSALDRAGRTIWIADAHREDGKVTLGTMMKKLTAFMERESAIRFASGQFV
jgi:hypothetical protein